MTAPSPSIPTPSTSSYADFTTRFGLDHKPHQETCVEWCMRCEKHNHGGLIADEMGLGKTIQVIALLHINNTQTSRTLIVVPVALIHQWREAFDRMPFESSTPMISNNVILYHGVQRNKTTYEQLATAKVVITTYGEISRKNINPETNTQVSASLVHEVQWTRVVFDEAHHLRNEKTLVHKSALNLRTNIKWLLTGTPIQNSKADFYALCRIINIPSRLYMGIKSCSTDNLKELVSNYLIKRTKKQLEIPMPELHEHIVSVDWENDYEREIAEQLQRRTMTAFEKRNTTTKITTPSMDKTEYRVNLPKFSNKMVEHLRARQMCVLPSLLQSELNKIRNGGQKTEEENDDDHQEPRQEVTDEELSYFEKGIEEGRCSSKLNAVVKHIVERRKSTENATATAEKKTIVFCEFRKEMDYLHKALASKKIYTERVDGSTPDKLKKLILNSQHIQVLLLQVKTCSEGLNLQQYTDVYIVTPQWNPTVEAQAICRSYRIGQKDNVNVFRFVMNNTHEQIQSIEMKVMKRQYKKREESRIIE